MARKQEKLPDELLPLLHAGVQISNKDYVTNEAGKVTKLNLSGKKISDLSPLAALTQITTLYLSNNQIQNIEPLKGLTQITKLYLSNNQIQNIDPLKGLTQITTLYLFINQIQNIEPLKGLTQITRLYLSGNQIQNIEPLKGLTQITRLDLSNNQIQNIEPLKGLTQITELYLIINQIQNIEPLKGLTQITKLYLSNNQIQNIEPLKGLTQITELSLSNNKIQDIDPLKGLTQITELSLFNNQIQDIDPLKGLAQITKLYLDDNQIQNIDPLKGLTQITKLSLSNNQIQNIDPLKGLTQITGLDLSKNQIQNIEPLNGLTQITTLYLSSNQIQNIEPLKGLTQITELYLSNNPVADEIPPETLSAGWNAIREWLNTQGRHEPIYEAKMLLLGNPNVGKSDLLYYLENKKTKPQKEKRDPTHGLVYRELTTINKSWKIHCWDFGGQEFYHATHQLFFSAGALHLLLWSAKDEQRNETNPETVFEADYWLRCIEQLSQGEGNIETIAVENKIDLALNEDDKRKQKDTYKLLNREENTKEFGNLELNTVKVSLQEEKRTEGLKELVKERLSGLFKKHPPKYAEFLRVINSSTKNVLTIAEIGGKENTDYIKTAMTVLHKIGCILYFRDVIPDKVFVKPAALLNLLYEHILNKEKKKSIHHKELAELINGNLLGLSAKEVTALLFHFHLIFTIPAEKDVYYIPQYLPGEPPWMEFLERLHFKKAYIRITSDAFIMHDALLRIFTEYGKYIKTGEGANPLFWKDGLVIDKNGQVLLIKFNRKAQCIDLFNDVEGTNFELQTDVTEFIVSLKTEKRETIQTNKATDKDEKNHEPLHKKEVWDSNYFTVLVSADGTYFASLKDIVQHIDDKLYHIEACAYDGKKKLVSVFDFNKYLPTNKQGRMRKLFISYSKTDLELVNKFTEHLSALKLDGKVATWYCTELTAGSTWHTEIQEHFDEADIVCFMISPNFMRTKYIHEHEIARAFKKQEDDKKKGKELLIVPIILDFCRWKTEKNDLTQFTALPYTAKPVVDFANQNMAWYLIEECLRLAIDNREQPRGDDYFKDHLPEDVKRLYERIVKGEVNA